MPWRSYFYFCIMVKHYQGFLGMKLEMLFSVTFFSNMDPLCDVIVQTSLALLPAIKRLKRPKIW